MSTLSQSPFYISTNNKLRWLSWAGEHLLGLSRLDYLYNINNRPADTREFIRFTLDTLGIQYSLSSGSLKNIPESGPAIIVANHPLGAIEGVILAEVLLGVRSDIKILANHFLERIPELNELFIGVDVFNGNDAAKKNIRPIKQAIQHTRNGGLLLVFPAGEVSSFKVPRNEITDKEWNRIIGMMVRKTDSQVTPVYIEGRNSTLFHLSGLIHPRLRTLMLPREMLNKKRQTIKLHIGNTMTPWEFKDLESDEAVTQYLRLNTYLLADYYHKSSTKRATNQAKTVIQETDQQSLFDNVMSLPNECLLLQNGNFDIYCADFSRLPFVMREIGRLREISFRAVGEGTGQPTDVDLYDNYYKHLFVWDREARCIVGAYRLGLVDEIISAHGIKGLYSRSLFNFNETLINNLNGVIELGRSFIRPEYQRNKNSLLLLWKGIAAYIYKHPEYNTLFGPVSISNSYSELSRALITSFLEIHHYDHSRAPHVRATNPQKKPRKLFWTPEMIAMLSDNKLISRLVERIEGDKGLPILVKQYLGLNGRLVSFNVDRDFNDALDGLIIVNLLEVPEKVLARYMGKDEAHQYLRSYREPGSSSHAA